MKDPISFYKRQLHTHRAQLAKVKKQLYVSGMLRLTIFLLIVFLVYWTFGNTQLVLGISAVGVALFLFLVSRHTRLQYLHDKTKALISINTTELEVQNRNFHHLPEGNEFKNPAHYFSQDIDLFGRGSFYQYANRTALREGSAALAAVFTENAIQHIVVKQKAIRELSELPEWRQEFSGVAALIKTSTDTRTIATWLEKYQPFVSQRIKYFTPLFSVGSIAILIATFFSLLPFSALLIWLSIGLCFSFFFFGKIRKLAAFAENAQSTFRQYQQLIVQLEGIEFQSSLLKEQQQNLVYAEKKTSDLLKTFSDILHTLDHNNNLLYLIFANGFFLQGLHKAYRIEKWIGEHGIDVAKWFDTVATFDAYNSLGNFAFNHPDYTFPTITDGSVLLTATKVGHPLLAPNKRVLNNIHIEKTQFFIVTGANMAGKSTFLRTVSLQIMMANVGLPVCAAKMDYCPMKLITSMRTTDSLTDEESYFFSELKRLRFIVDALESDTYFIVLDEILKGTNSSDKAIGSRKFLEKLVGAKATGIIATHDLSLCEAAEEMKQLQNYYFDAEIVNNELHFDYTFKKGICQNMNASFLLKKMGIVD
ncbi:DNA mismatch repair protein MutS [Arenibacter sp. GZD96]|uniref:MutS-related protein n=1 Tax=Aurantibrevibacter litoralis TaxID=3106030 RepID=UPI002AFF1EEA|nr:hypothetical protein [Arenibacter sp. GZD-96]MEA1784473.1 DNA mismatch repair protein MutS [Arenibacter sp. GZD-96]